MNSLATARTPVALTIAGSDSGGGAGIQADLKAFARCGVHGTCAITAITAQNTLGVQAIHPVPPEIVLAQVRAVLGDIGVDAVKVGMLGTAEVAYAVARALDELPASVPVVVDPVMVAESGARLLETGAQRALVEEIVPRATVLTPNLPEARVLVELGTISQRRPTPGASERSEEAKERAAQAEAKAEEKEARELVRAVLALGPRAVVLTGGHRARAVDLLLDSGPGSEPARDRHEPRRTGNDEREVEGAVPGVPEAKRAHKAHEVIEIPGERHSDGAAHGSGCTHSSILAAQLALGRSVLDAAQTARRLAGEAVANGLRDLGAGAGPVDVIDLKRMRAGAGG